VIGRLERAVRRVRRVLSRSEWAIRLLRLPVSHRPPTAPGLVMIQIDGLSHTQLGLALERGEMPFLKRLLGREGYRLHVHYAGVPSSTPDVQGELFYAVRRAVPAFSFRDASGEIVRMFDPGPASRVERALAEQGEPLLAEGSAYADVYTGGAAESHFCPAAMGLGDLIRAANPFALALLLISNLYSFLRAAVLLVVEFPLALADAVRGSIGGRSLGKELKFVVTRVLICILMRELIVIGAKVDVARGLRIVHLNLLGYDEQAHRRGPSSRFAHWALKGIDDAIARIWRAARASDRRDYDVWVYADHGQEETLPYEKHHGRPVHDAVVEAFGRAGEAVTLADRDLAGIQLQRVRLFGGRRSHRLAPAAAASGPGELAVAAMGPIGLVYYDRPLDDALRERIAGELVQHARVPLVLTAEADGTARAHTERGVFHLPEAAAEVLGADHPFREEAARDLAALAHHPQAGAFVLSGWRTEGTPYTFPLENGSHAGPGPEETHAFALLPDDAPLPARSRAHLTPSDLRAAALDHLARRPVSASARRGTAEADTLRIMTYNVHSCIGMDGHHAPERIARVIARHRPDIVALQELDVGRSRTGGIDQAHRIAQHLEMDCHFHPALHIEEERYGDAVLTHLPMRLVKAAPLPGIGGRPRPEPRGAIWTAIEVNGVELHLINTHLGLRERERRRQVEALLGSEWLGHPDCAPPVVLCGDFNARPESAVCMHIRGRLHDAQGALEGHRPRHTIPGRYPFARIDHVFVDPRVEVVDVHVPRADLEQVASDHLPLIVEVRLPRPADDADAAQGAALAGARRGTD